MKLTPRHQTRLLRIPPKVQETLLAPIMNLVVSLTWHHALKHNYGIMVINNGRFPTPLLAKLLLGLKDHQKDNIITATDMKQAHIKSIQWQEETNNRPLRIFYYEDYYVVKQKAR